MDKQSNALANKIFFFTLKMQSLDINEKVILEYLRQRHNIPDLFHGSIMF